MKRSKRFETLEARPVHQDGFIKEWKQQGLVAMESELDPKPSIKIENGKIVEIDGTLEKDFDFIDRFIADFAIDIEVAREAMDMPSVDMARMLVDIHVGKDEIKHLVGGMTPAKLVDVMKHMNVVEMMMAMQKMRERRTPSNQCHVTNVKDNPMLIAADAAEAGMRGFDEEETTVAIARYAPLTALGLLIGSQTGRPGILTQCAVEEAVELKMGMKGLTTYAETLSVYGTEKVFIDGDDTPYSKSFLASAYMSRGMKVRCTSGTGSEALMGNAQGKSMLYLEARCLMMIKGGGVQGTQNGAVSCIGMTGSVPSGVRAVLAENLLAAMEGLECASSNDQSFSHSDIRRTARMLMQMLPGTDFIFSGYSTTPNYDNMFAGSNFDAEDFDDYNVLQRDLKVDGGLRPVKEEDIIAVRRKAAKAVQAVFAYLDFPLFTDEEVEEVAYAHGSRDIGDRVVNDDLKAAEKLLDGDLTGLDIVRGLSAGGFDDIAAAVLEMLKQRLSGDYMQTSAILNEQFEVNSSLNNPNDYQGPGTGYRVDGERWEQIKNLGTELDPQSF